MTALGRLGGRVPLRTQILVLLLAAVALVVVVTSTAGYAALRGYLLQRVDGQLSDIVVGVARGALPQSDPDGDGAVRHPPGPRGPKQYLPADTLVIRRYDASGALVERLGGLLPTDTAGPRLPSLTTARAAQLADGHFTVRAVDGSGRWRADVAPLTDGTSLVVALPLGDVDDTVRRLLLIDLLVGLTAVVGAGTLTWAGVRRSLQPLRAVESTAEEIAGGDLSVRVPAADPRTEVGSLAQSFNAMVDRFESAFRAQQRSEAEARASEDRMRRFVGDASHELRTPLTSIRGFAELYRQGAVPDEEALQRVMRRIEDEAARMGLLVEDLLLLARLDQQRPIERRRVDLLTVAADVVHDASVVQARTVRLTPPDGSAPLTVLGDDARLRQVLGNLVTNATRHTPPETVVDVVLRSEPDAAVVEVRDDGPGMTPEVAARVFERFYRADSSRTRGATPTSGSGLGLSIVAALVAAHGGTVAVDTAPGRGTTMRVRLPREAAGVPAGQAVPV